MCGVGVSCIGERRSHMVEGGADCDCAYRSIMAGSGVAVISISECLSECRDEAVRSHCCPSCEEGVDVELQTLEVVDPAGPSPVCVGVSAGLNGVGSI